ncbi:MAG: hypothetical protein ACMUIG_06395 [Thermoplasmatota archaeon]
MAVPADPPRRVRHIVVEHPSELEKPLTTFPISDSFPEALSYYLYIMVMISLLIFIPFTIFIFILLVSSGPASEAFDIISLFFLGGIGVFMVFLLPVFILSILALWSLVKGKSRVDIYPDRMNIHLAGTKGEWVENTIRFRYVVRARTIGNEAYRNMFVSTPRWKRLLFRRPRNPGGGFYHNFTDPKNLVILDMAGMQRIFNFNEHSLSNFGEGSVNKGKRIMDMDGIHVCSSSGRIVTGGDRKNYGPAVERYQVNRIYLGIKRKDRDQFITMADELIKLNMKGYGGIVPDRPKRRKKDLRHPALDLEIVGW